MNKKIMKKTVAATLLASSIFSGTSITYGKEISIQQSIDAVKFEMKNAPLHYVNPALKSVLEPSKDLYPVLNNVKKHYKEVKQQIQKSNLSTKVKKDKIKELDSLYDEKIIKGVIPYIDAYNYAVKYLDPILKEMLDAHATGDLDGVEQAYHKLSYQLDSRTSILYRFTGKAPRDLLLEKYKKPSDAKRDELRIPVTIFMKNNDVLRLWNEGKKEEAKKVMDEVLTLVAKTTNNGDTNYSNLLSKEVQEAEALFSAQPTPSPVVPNNPSMSNGDDEPKESSAERKLRIAKSNAIVELGKYKDTNKEDYSLTNWSTILSLKTTWTSTIHSATSPTDVENALSDAKAAIDAIQTSSQEALTTAKENAKTELTTYKVTDQDDYSTANWETILSLKTMWTSTINSATTVDEVTQALKDAKAAITQVQTSEQEALVTAKAQAIENLTDFKTTEKDNYSTANWDTILSIKTTWTSTINSAMTIDEVTQALNDAKAAITQVQTSEQEALVTAKAQAIENLTDFKTTEKDNYSTANWDTILSIKTTWTSIINSAMTEAEVVLALNDAKAAIDQVVDGKSKTLIADLSSNNVDNKLEITIPDNAAWKSKIVEVMVDNISLTSDQYSIGVNILTINQGVIKSKGIKTITIVADGYEESTVNQIVNAGEFSNIKSSVQHIGGIINVGGTPVYKLSAKDQYGNVIEGYHFGLKLNAVNNNHKVNEKVEISSDGVALITYTMPQTTAGIPAIVDTPIGVTNSNGELIVTIHYFGRGIQGTDFDYNDSVGPLWFDASGNRIF
ncbi:hemoblobin-interacting domain-containing protein [Psychrobacillus psychrodurans]|uniref:hemoblobin-interacting domain-containing protein n=1 Tax=Psychrobacillus psychrodurans TaxID=126157 RepID=UPI003CFE4C0B